MNMTENRGKKHPANQNGEERGPWSYPGFRIHVWLSILWSLIRESASHKKRK